MPVANALSGGEVVPIVQDGLNKKVDLLPTIIEQFTKCVWLRNVFNSSMGGVVSNSGLTHTNSRAGIGSMVVASLANSTGKRYFEVRMDAVFGAGTPTVGVAQSNASSSQVGGGPTVTTNRNSDWGLLANSGNKYYSGIPTAYGTSLVTNDILTVAVDLDSDSIWWGKNGTWFAGGNPSAGTGAAFTNVQDAVYPAVTNSEGSKVTANFAGPFQYTPPTGFQPWDS
jgi:hypothetical protein